MRVRDHILIFLFYLAAAVVITFPLITVIGTRLIGHPFGDAYEYIHHIWWIKTALQTGQDPFFMPNLVYPDGVPAPLLWSIPLQSFPAWLLAFVLPLPLAFNLPALLTLALNGWAMCFLVRYLLGGRGGFRANPYVDVSTVSALVAGLIFMIYPAFQGQLGAAHVGLLVLYPAPLYLYMLLRLRGVTSARWTILAGALLFMISLWGSVLLLIYMIAPITAFYFAALLAARDGRTLRRAAATVLLGGLFALPFVVPLALDTLNAPLAGGSVRYSASLLGIVSPSFYHPLFEHWSYNRQVLGLDPFEMSSYVGIIAAALALVAVWRVRAARGWLALALIVWVFSLGPLLKIFDQPFAFRIDGYASYVTLPWALFQNLPLLNIARTPARFNFAVGFAVAVLAGYGAALVLSAVRGSRLRGLAAAVLMLLVAFEYQVWWGLPTIPGSVPEPIASLAVRDDIRAVLDVPGYHPLANKDGMFLQTGHAHPLIVGQVSRESPVNPAKVGVLQATLDLALLDAADIDIVIVHKDYAGEAGELGSLARRQFGAPFYEDANYAAYDVPAPSAPPAFTVVPPAVTTIETQVDSYAYAPADGWISFSARLMGDNRAVNLLLDGVIVARWQVTDTATVSAPLPVRAGMFHTVSLALDPPCPAHHDATLTCAAIEAANFTFDFAFAPAAAPVRFEKGVTLENAYLLETARAGDMLPVWLLWAFDQPRGADDIRFVHITNAAGELVAQQDIPLGEIAAGERRAESVEIALPADLPPGEYTVRAGWYAYPEIANFCLLADAPAAACAEPFAALGAVTLAD